ncbi:ATP-dependent RNA helicase DDX24-like [Oppia nitens]|uniref:ATP-dependent RNA helicase DDX24-like n=1 Tax=Oppia nitens TaxID=1686743 RepID=UPI0023DC717E|nr:ATP-dependent RNA helicase DDX24-like [Oppia nitens]
MPFKSKPLKWKPVVIESTEGFNDTDFDGLVAIEELGDYCIENRDNKTDNKRKVKKRKNKSKKFKQNVTEEDSDDNDDEEDNEPSVDTLQSMHLWQNMSIPDDILKALNDLTFTSPTPIQSETIKVAIEDKLDILGAAQTGSGKTLAFGIPLVTHIMKDKMNSDESKLRALVLAPTRELAIQVKKHLEAITKYIGVTVGVLVGGMSVQKQERILKKLRPDIIVATPGRLWELMEDESSDHLTSRTICDIKYLVIDEADRMAEKGHFKDLVKLLNLIKQNLIEKQIFIFSATLTLTYSLPKRLDMKTKNKKNTTNKLTEKQKLKNFIEFFGLKSESTKVIDLTKKGVAIPEQQLTEFKINCLSEEKDLYLYYFLVLFKGRTLIFCNSKDCLRRIVNILRILQLNPLSLHSSMPQKKRLLNLEKFTSNSESVLIASDVAARGLDIPHVDHVVHYQIPRTAEIYIHRCGRTARAFNTGLSLLICEPKEEANYYKQLCNTLNKGNDIQDFIIDRSNLRSLKQRIDLALKCDKLDHKIRKEKSHEDWFRLNAKKCEILNDSDSDSSEESKHKNSNEMRKLKVMKKQLNFLINKPISQTKSMYIHLIKGGLTNNIFKETKS